MDPTFLFIFAIMLVSLSMNSRRLANKKLVELETLDAVFTKPLAITVTEHSNLKAKEGAHVFALSDGTVRITYEFWRQANETESMEIIIIDVPNALAVSIGFCNEEIETLQWHEYVLQRKPSITPRQYNEAVGLLRRVRNRVIEVLNTRKTTVG